MTGRKPSRTTGGKTALFGAVLACLVLAAPVRAQDAAAPPQQPQEIPAAPAAAQAQPPAAMRWDIQVNPNDMPSLLFTYWEHTAIVDAKKSRGLVRPPTEDELTRGLQNNQEEKIKPPPEEREITLGGIAFTKAGDWTIWLNGKRVTPQAVPKEVMDLKVSREYIEMKWFDDYTNQIFPIRLRPHQRFNIDTRIFLPG